MGKTKTIQYVRKEILNKEVNNLDTLCLIFSGEVWVFIANHQNSREVTVQVKEPHSGYAELALLTGGLRLISAVTLKRAAFALIPKQEFDNWLTNCPDVKLNFL